MYCTHCGTKLDNDAIFCTSCGSRVENSPSVSHVNKEKVYYGEEANLRNFMGTASDSILKSKFNVFALLFGANYIGFKKMYLFSIAWTALVSVVLYYNPFLAFLVNLVLCILFSFLFNNIYIKYAKKEIKKIESSDNLSELLVKKGRNSAFGIFLPILVFAFCLIIITYING